MKKACFKKKTLVEKTSSNPTPYIVEEPSDSSQNDEDDVHVQLPLQDSPSSPKKEEILHWIFTGESPFLFNCNREDYVDSSSISNEKSSFKDSGYFKSSNATPIDSNVNTKNKSFKIKTLLSTNSGNISVAMFNDECSYNRRTPLRENMTHPDTSTPIVNRVNELNMKSSGRFDNQKCRVYESSDSDSSVLTSNYIKSVNKNCISNDNHIRNLRYMSKTNGDHDKNREEQHSRHNFKHFNNDDVFLTKENITRNKDQNDNTSNPEWSTFLKSNSILSPNRFNTHRHKRSAESSGLNFKTNNNGDDIDSYNFSSKHFRASPQISYKRKVSSPYCSDNYDYCENNGMKTIKCNVLKSIQKTVAIQSNGSRKKVIEVIKQVYLG